MQYLGTKIVTAEPMTRLEYNQLRGWTVPADENPEDAGYLVEYQDGGKPNVPGRAGYVSWSPKEVFESAYRPCAALTFGLAIEALRHGKAIARAGWNGRDMFVYLVAPNAYAATSHVARTYFGTQLVPYNAYMAIKGADGRVSTWTPSIGDSLAEDWYLVDLDKQAGTASQVDPIMAKPSIPAGRVAETMDHAQLQALGTQDALRAVSAVQVTALQVSLEAISAHPTKDAEAAGDMPAPHVPKEMIDALVASLQFKVSHVAGTTTTVALALLPSMSNFVVAQGGASCVSMANFDAAKGVKYAIEGATLKAREKLWEFEGYSLAKDLARRQQLTAPPYLGTQESRFAIGERVSIDATVVAVNFTPSKVRYVFDFGAGELALVNSEHVHPSIPLPGCEQGAMHLIAEGTPAYQVRVYEEKWALDEKVRKLAEFVHADKFLLIDADEQVRLHMQLDFMRHYSGALAERIAAF